MLRSESPDIRLLHGIGIHHAVSIKPVDNSEFVEIVSVKSPSVVLAVTALFELVCQVNDAQDAKGAV